MRTSTPVDADAGICRWRTAFWVALPATPVATMLLGAVLATGTSGHHRLAVLICVAMVAVIPVNAVTWRWPRLSGVTLGLAAPVLAIVLFLGPAWFVFAASQISQGVAP